MRRRIAVLIALVGLCAAVSGCVSDLAAPVVQSSGNSQLRYYGGPKSSMWRGPVEN
jgi:hypothetical protein